MFKSKSCRSYEATQVRNPKEFPGAIKVEVYEDGKLADSYYAIQQTPSLPNSWQRIRLRPCAWILNYTDGSTNMLQSVGQEDFRKFHARDAFAAGEVTDDCWEFDYDADK